MSGYVFVSNSSKPNEEKLNDRTPIHIGNVGRPCLKSALDRGYDVYYGVNRANPEELVCDMPVHLFESHTYRSISAIKDNFIAYKNLCKVIDSGKVDVIHCNTPIGGMVGRLAGKRKKVKKVIYTAHGFHFYKGAPLFNRTFLKWAEKLMAHWTDAIITMNKEDFEVAQKFKLRNKGKVYFVHGVGVNLADYADIGKFRDEKRAELGLTENDIAMISMGDLVPRKNYSVAIEAISKADNPNLQYFICGKGPELENLKKLAQDLNVSKQVHFLGFRKDIKELISAVDVFLFTTKQEGLPRSMMEAMAGGLPCIASKIRGNEDLIENGVNGFLCSPTNSDEFAEAIVKLISDKDLMNKIRNANLEKIKQYDVSVVAEEIEAIYKEVLG